MTSANRDTQKGMLAPQIVSEIETILANGSLRQGDRLPTERQLGERFGVSRSTVREALHELELKGRVERVRGRGTTVARDEESGETSRITLLARYSSQDRRIAELMDFRYAIEPVISRCAALSATPADVYELRIIAAQMEDDPPIRIFRRLDEHFHSLIGRATHNSMFVALVDTSWEALRPTRLMQNLQRPEDRQVSLRAHREVLEAIEAGSGDRAEEAMRSHMKQVTENIGLTSTAGLEPPAR